MCVDGFWELVEGCGGVIPGGAPFLWVLGFFVRRTGKFFCCCPSRIPGLFPGLKAWVAPVVLLVRALDVDLPVRPCFYGPCSCF